MGELVLQAHQADPNPGSGSTDHRLKIVVSGAALHDADTSRALLDQLTALAGPCSGPTICEEMASAELKGSVATPDPREHGPDASGRSELFTTALPTTAVSVLLDELTTGRPRGIRKLTFTALGGAYNRMATEATAYAHRTQRFLLDHLAEDPDGWVDRSWAIAHPYGTGGVYPNFPDPQLDDPDTAHHGANLARLVKVKNHYDPGRLFHVPQAVYP